ncbi:probable N-acetylglucosaminyl-phosphatidylinositol de-N-acetylase [Aspergillus udagawae]|uniref:N-acetylglucosaminylphosphatidylinositol deacetylase n=1 Tax=Aspergillus udagawae TaxID=91492 RepID=A0ABQ1A149_9EURO|nr:probable N-acetylglucosaminyl-phosphatidylinositol de-N-acetylase [Aspergillus udagawae]GFF71052.1 probable N-acetylglucosaminyl-phosphatidylinositol de-N-acetylase [Aspergillus udagawae]GFG13083.1 probable N-acetylglucosaminyl-phosphatidylinositol de-N-acetylase [Aspergillus udagawae]GFG22154.1 probable N-acetylglucosaminyl-phosphatidylinositol de-N-acetylase [Aspergillus udagawae]
MLTASLVTWGLTLSAIFLFWTLSSTSSSPFARNFPRLLNKRICLLIAHPDDEAMFFSPTVLALTKPELGNHVKILCLSSGDADGLGHIRKKELQQSAKHLGLRAESDVFIIDDPARFPDSMTATWSESDVSSLLASAFAPDLASQSQSQSSSSAARKRVAGTGAPTATIDVLITFDKHGISNHPNHRSLYHGAVHFLRALMKDKAGYTCPVTLYTLTTTSILRKYIGVLDAPWTMASGALGSIFAGAAKGGKDDMPGKLLFISSVDEYIRAQAAMVKAHKSQMVWFRYGWITLGRYMVVNDLRRVSV